MPAITGMPTIAGAALYKILRSNPQVARELLANLSPELRRKLEDLRTDAFGGSLADQSALLAQAAREIMSYSEVGQAQQARTGRLGFTATVASDPQTPLGFAAVPSIRRNLVTQDNYLEIQLSRPGYVNVRVHTRDDRYPFQPDQPISSLAPEYQADVQALEASVELAVQRPARGGRAFAELSEDERSVQLSTPPDARGVRTTATFVITTPGYFVQRGQVDVRPAPIGSYAQFSDGLQTFEDKLLGRSSRTAESGAKARSPTFAAIPENRRMTYAGAGKAYLITRPGFAVEVDPNSFARSPAAVEAPISDLTPTTADPITALQSSLLRGLRPTPGRTRPLLQLTDEERTIELGPPLRKYTVSSQGYVDLGFGQPPVKIALMRGERAALELFQERLFDKLGGPKP